VSGAEFVHSWQPKLPMSDYAILGAVQCMGMGKDEMNGHRFRATATAILDEVRHERYFRCGLATRASGNSVVFSEGCPT
jgi:hypothetical protein